MYYLLSKVCIINKNVFTYYYVNMSMKDNIPYL